MEIRYVEWIDSAGGSRWTNSLEVAKEPVRTIRTVGYVLVDEPDRITLVQSEDPPIIESDGGQTSVNNYIVIPRTAITRQCRIVEP